MSAALLPLPHHGLLVAVPFALPVLVLTLGIAALALRERRRREREGPQLSSRRPAISRWIGSAYQTITNATETPATDHAIVRLPNT